MDLSVSKRLHTVCFDFSEGYHFTTGNTNWYAMADLARKRRAVMVAFKISHNGMAFRKDWLLNISINPKFTCSMPHYLEMSQMIIFRLDIIRIS